MVQSDHREAEILEACLSRLIQGNASVDDLLRAYPRDAAWLKPLLLVAAQTRQAVELPAMPAQARLAGERRLRGHIRSRTPHRAPSRGRPLRPAFALASVALVIALLGSVSGIAYAAEASLPGDNLYPVKQAIERAQLAISPTLQSDVELLVDFSEERLREAEQLSAKGRTQDLPAALKAYGRTVEGLLALADRLPDQDGDEALQSIARQMGRQAEVLAHIQASAPQAAQPGLMQAMEQSTRHREAVEEMLEVRSREPGRPDDRGKKATPSAPQTPAPGQGKEKDPGKGESQGRGRPPETPSH